MRRERHARTARRSTQPYHVFACRDDFFRHRLSTAGGASLPSPESAEPDSSRRPLPPASACRRPPAKRARPTARLHLHRARRASRTRRPSPDARDGRAGPAARVSRDGRDGTASSRAAARRGASSAPRHVRCGNYRTLLRRGKPRSTPARPIETPTAAVIGLELPRDRGPEHRPIESYTPSSCIGRLRREPPGCDPTARAHFAPADRRPALATPPCPAAWRPAGGALCAGGA